MDAFQQFGSNVIGFQMVIEERQWYIVGCYLTPDDTSTIESVVAALKERPQGAKLLVMGDMNVKLSDMEGYWRGEEIASALITEGMEDMPDHFLLHRRPWYRDGRMCSMVWVGREVRSRTDYTLGTYHHLFWNVYVHDPMHNLDHYLVLGCLCSASLGNTPSTSIGASGSPFDPPTTPVREDGTFAALRRAVPKTKARDARKNVWMLADTWRIVSERVSACHDPVRDQSLIQSLGHAIAASLK